MAWWCGNPVERFEKKYSLSEAGCWEWNGFLTDGYGTFKYGGKHVRAHRFSYELHYGPIPSDKVVMHSCDNPKCVNPGHLSIGTPLENNRDAISKGRRSFRENHPNARLTESQVTEIRKKYGAGSVRQSDLAVEYGVSRSNVQAIVSNRTW